MKREARLRRGRDSSRLVKVILSLKKRVFFKNELILFSGGYKNINFAQNILDERGIYTTVSPGSTDAPPGNE
ncbi:MAG: hypothetical protein HBSAPP04_04040 [Ignavibacteriaceae bacterium]|nr:MAG: hypothetical protein HBSAPP04_04040 [Ignavibacteriaceae bacterium]